MPVDPKTPLAKVIISDCADGADCAVKAAATSADDHARATLPPSTPYRTTDAFEAIVALDASRRDNARLRAARRRGSFGIAIALAASCITLAAFSTVLVLRYVPANAGETPAVTCPSLSEQLAAATPPLEAVPDGEPPLVISPLSEGPSALEELGGDAALKQLAKEITAALLADPVLRRNPRLAAVGHARLEIAVRQSLITLVDGAAETENLDVSELMWEIRPTHTEWEAATAVLDRALYKYNVSESNRSAIDVSAGANESVAVDDTATRANALAARASVGLSCPESAITSRPLESSDARIVTGCGKRAIYTYVYDLNASTSAWHREVAP